MDEVTHRITLSNGQVVVLTESKDNLSLGVDDGGDPWHILDISPSGILVMPNSGSAPDDLTRGLK